MLSGIETNRIGIIFGSRLGVCILYIVQRSNTVKSTPTTISGPLVKNLLLLIVTAFVALPTAGFGEDSPPPTIQEPTRQHMFSFTTSDVYILAGGTALTALALGYENQEQMRDNLDEYLDGPSDFGNSYGSVWAAAGLTLALGGVGYFGNKPRFTDAALDMATALVVTTAAVTVLKYAVDRTRPNNELYSFPSGHTASAFCVGAVLNRHFGWKVGFVAYTAAVFTGFGRIEDDRHYLSDVLAGATIGLLAGRSVSFPFRSHRVSACLDGQRWGLAVNF